ncbi:MAG: PspC domain-containing protein [Arachnia sp.]
MPELVHPSQLDPRLADLTREQSTGFSAGLCRALAGRWQVDPLIVRLVFLALTFAGGVGIALYVWGWLLIPRVGGTPPILRWLPAFGTWPKNTQAIIVAVSSLVLVLSTARSTGVGWGPVIVVGALAWGLARRRRKAATSSYPPPHTSSSAATQASPVRGSTESVEQWRARLSPHNDSPLPLVDLYAAEPSRTPSAHPAEETRRTNWWATTTIIVSMAITAAVPIAMGLDSAVLWAGVAASGTAAVLILLHALFLRSHRLPAVLLLLVLTGAVATGLLASNRVPVADAAPAGMAVGDQFHSYLGEAPARLDLTGLPSDEAATIFIDATASVVEIRLDDPPGSIEVNSDTIAVETSYSSRSQTASDVTLVIDGDFSVIDIETLS